MPVALWPCVLAHAPGVYRQQSYSTSTEGELKAVITVTIITAATAATAYLGSVVQSRLHSALRVAAAKRCLWGVAGSSNAIEPSEVT